MNKLHGIFSNDSLCYISKISEHDENYSQLKEGSEQELTELAKEQGYKIVHLFIEREDDYDQVYYTFLTTIGVN